ncbi:sugar ABC transporter substrate-binding protein [Brevibacillus sp. B_LB10_24]|uniref:sugar ABC transporter substrate-binding protein n=1 Tax=Brevibacillus sp. B_LB10_24 TaxID=3380645 RepID=UPI0038B8564D
MPNEAINRREFLKKCAKWTFAGLGISLGGGLLSSWTSRDAIDDFMKTSQADLDFLAFSNKSLGYYFYIIQQEAANRAALARGWEFQALVADFDAGKQSRQLAEFIERKPVALIADPIDSEGFTLALESASLHSIPVGIIDTPLTGGGEAAITIAFDNYKGGEMAAGIIVDLLVQKYGKPRGTVLNCYGQLSSSAWRLRKEGFEAYLDRYPDIRLLSVPTEGDIMKMYDATIEALTQMPQLDAIHAPSETPARGVYEALKTKNKLYPADSAEHIFFVTIDGEPIALQWIKEGYLDASISQDPIAYGEICVEMLEKQIQAGQVPLGSYTNNRYYWKEAEIVSLACGPSLILPPYCLDRSNVDDKRHWANIAFNDWGITYQ